MWVDRSKGKCSKRKDETSLKGPTCFVLPLSLYFQNSLWHLCKFFVKMYLSVLKHMKWLISSLRCLWCHLKSRSEASAFNFPLISCFPFSCSPESWQPHWNTALLDGSQEALLFAVRHFFKNMFFILD